MGGSRGSFPRNYRLVRIDRNTKITVNSYERKRGRRLETPKSAPLANGASHAASLLQVNEVESFFGKTMGNFFLLEEGFERGVLN